MASGFANHTVAALRIRGFCRSLCIETPRQFFPQILQVFLIDHTPSIRQAETDQSFTYLHWSQLTVIKTEILWYSFFALPFFFFSCGFTFSFCGFGNQSATSQVSGPRAFPTSQSVRGEITWTRDGNSRAVMQGGEGGRGGSGVRTAVCVRQCANAGIMLSSSHCQNW